jgi:ferredoxin-thioredoxin reductase catalytic chain
MQDKPSAKSLERIGNLVENYCRKSGTTTHSDETITEAVVLGLAQNLDDLGKPLCPCRFYPDKKEEATHRTWICACDDMQIYKYCHCLLFVTESGQPITEYLPEGHEGRAIHGVVRDPTPELGRPLRHKSDERERERLERPS